MDAQNTLSIPLPKTRAGGTEMKNDDLVAVRKRARPNTLAANIVKASLFLMLLYLFLLGIGLLGGSFKMLGKGIAEALLVTTANPFAGLFIGLLTTSIVQSSSVTTSITVALVSGGAISIHNAIPIIMGANIGTTVTCLLVSLGHLSRTDEFERAFAGANMHDAFNVLTVLLLFPLQVATGFLEKASSFLAGIFYGSQSQNFDSPMKFIIDPMVNRIYSLFSGPFGLSAQAVGIISIILSLILIFVALTFMVRCIRSITASRLEKSINRVFSANIYVIFLIGLVVTSIIQSSSVTTSIMIPMIGAGLVSLEQAFPITVGANIGTTVTALMASLAGNRAGLTIAFAHLLFNVCGTLIFFVPPWTRRIPIAIAKALAGFIIKKKKLAIAYLLVVFYALPLVLMLATRSK